MFKYQHLVRFIKTFVNWVLAKTHLDQNRAVLYFFKNAYHHTENIQLYFRSLKFVTRVFGYSNTPSRDNVEIDITYRCNLACNNCNRSLGDGQAQTNDSMSLEQIEKFIDDSIKNNFNWKQIRILGGEPTLHRQFFEVLDIFLKTHKIYALFFIFKSYLIKKCVNNKYTL